MMLRLLVVLNIIEIWLLVGLIAVALAAYGKLVAAGEGREP